MTLDQLADSFSRYQETEFLEFRRIDRPRHVRPDLCAFLMIDEALQEGAPVGSLPYNHDLIDFATHEEIGLSVAGEDLAKVATDDLVRDLVRCGLRYDASTDSLVMFV